MFRGNRVYRITEDGKKKLVPFNYIKGLHISFKGKNSIVEIKEPLSKFHHSKIKLGDNSIVKIGAHIDCNWKIQKLRILGFGKNQKVTIGDNFRLNGANIILGFEDNLAVNIGDDCMFSDNIKLQASDRHSVIDSTTKEVLNYGKDINIGNHVWLTGDIDILKGVTIADNCIIGRKSVVSKSCEEANCLYAGCPAIKRKSNVNWLVNSPKRKDLDV